MSWSRRSTHTLLACGIALAASCTHAPLAPTTVPAAAPVANGPGLAAAPSIAGLTAQGRRPRQPANFADLADAIDVTARLTASTGAATYDWTASLGTIVGSGANVVWQAPAVAATPVEVTLTVKVTDAGGTTSASTDVSLHDSSNEIDTLARAFLLDFSNSRLRSVSAIMRNFAPSCYGTDEEARQVAANRERFTILQWHVGAARTEVAFGGVCPFRNRKGDACTVVPVRWKSIDFRLGAVGSVEGDDWVASFYMPDERRWRLCDSQFDGQALGAPSFIQ
jgi:hypothetical protein